MTTISSLSLVTVLLISEIKSFSTFSVTRNTSDQVFFDTDDKSELTCSDIHAYSSNGKSCKCNYGRTYFDTVNSSQAKCHRDSKQSDCDVHFINSGHQYVKAVDISGRVSRRIGNFANCPSASIHRADYWSDKKKWSNASNHQFQVQGAQLQWKYSSPCDIRSKNYGLLWRLMLQCYKNGKAENKCALLKIKGTRNYPLSFTSVSTAFLCKKSTPVTISEIRSSASRPISSSVPTSPETALPLRATTQTISSNIVSPFSSIQTSYNAAQPLLTSSKSMEIQTAVAQSSYRSYMLSEGSEFVISSQFPNPPSKNNGIEGKSKLKSTNRAPIIVGCLSAFAVVMVTGIVLFICRKKRYTKQNNATNGLTIVGGLCQTTNREYVDANCPGLIDTAEKLQPSELNNPAYGTSILLTEPNSKAAPDCDLNIQQYKGGRHIDKNENRKCENTVCNPDNNAEYSYAFPDGITKNAGQRGKEGISLSVSHYNGANCKTESENPYYDGWLIMPVDREGANDSNDRTSDYNSKSENTYAEMGVKGDSAKAEDQSDERNLYHSSTRDELESDNPYYGGIRSEELIHN